jgi:hypothetical protein
MNATFGALRCSDLKVLRCSRATGNYRALTTDNPQRRPTDDNGVQSNLSTEADQAHGPSPFSARRDSHLTVAYVVWTVALRPHSEYRDDARRRCAHSMRCSLLRGTPVSTQSHRSSALVERRAMRQCEATGAAGEPGQSEDSSNGVKQAQTAISRRGLTPPQAIRGSET